MPLQTTVVEFDVANHSYRDITLADLKIDEHEKNKIYWVHCDLNHVEELKSIAGILQLPDTVLNLCHKPDPIPKMMEDGHSLTIQLEALLSPEFDSSHEAKIGNIIFYLTSQFCFTATIESIQAILQFKMTYSKSLKYAKTPCFTLFLILDNVINDFSKILLDFEWLADQTDLTIRETQENIYNEVMNIKKQIMKAQHHIAAIRDILMRVSGRKMMVISEKCRASLENLLDHSQIIFNEAEAIRENLRNTLDQIDNALMQKMNNTMKVLTAFAAIFLPLTLIAGIYGMNFRWIPELDWRFGYFWALGLMLICGLVLYIIFRMKKWF